jgi:hypothetical protein
VLREARPRNTADSVRFSREMSSVMRTIDSNRCTRAVLYTVPIAIRLRRPTEGIASSNPTKSADNSHLWYPRDGRDPDLDRALPHLLPSPSGGGHYPCAERLRGRVFRTNGACRPGSSLRAVQDLHRRSQGR